MRNILNFLIIHAGFLDNLKGGDQLNFKILLLAALVLFASTATIVATSFQLTMPKKLWGIENSDSTVLDGFALPCLGEIDNPGGP